MIDEYGDDIDEYGEYNEAGEEEDVEYEEEERQPTQEEVEYLGLRQRLKESIRKKMKRKEGGGTHLNSLEKKRKLPFNDFGSFFGPSHPVISSRVIQESKSLLENQQLASRSLNSRNTSKKPISASSSGPKGGPSERRPKVVNEVKRKVEKLKDTRDYSFLFSDDAEVPAPSKGSSLQSNPTANSDHLYRSAQLPAKNKQPLGSDGRNGYGGRDDKKLGSTNSHLNSRVGSSGSRLHSKPGTSSKQLLSKSESSSGNQLLSRSGSSGNQLLSRSVSLGRRLPSKPGSELPTKPGSSSSQLNSRPGSSGGLLNSRPGYSGSHLKSRPSSTVSELDTRRSSTGSQLQPRQGSSSSQLHHRRASLGSQMHSRPVSLGTHSKPSPGISASRMNPRSGSSGSQVHSRTVSSTNGQVHRKRVPSTNRQIHSKLETHKPASTRRPESLPIDKRASIPGSKNLNSTQRLVYSKPQPSLVRQNGEQRRISHEPSRSQMVPKQSAALSKHQINRPLKQAPSRDAIDNRRLKNKPVKMSEDDLALSMIRKMFKTDRYAGRVVEDDDSDMEANFDDIMREESRSAKIARQEDEEQLRLIEEEERQERMRKAAKKRKLSHHR